MIGLITVFKVIFYFLAICFSIGTLIWIFKDLRPWRKKVRTKIWRYLVSDEINKGWKNK
jgi:tellurite resistance protein TehA-like permease